MRNKKQAQGFTLIELLIVIAIIGILAAVLIPNLLSARARANETATQAYIRNCYTAVETERDPVTQALPADGSCAGNQLGASAITTTPAAVSAAGSYTADGTGGFSVTAESITGTGFTFNGSTMTEN